MPNLVIALVILFGGWWLLRKLGNAQPAAVRGMMRKAAGAGLMIVSAILAMRGAIQIAAPLFLLGLGMFGQFAGLLNSGALWRKSSGQKSRVATSVLDMELDHDTGAMDGTVLQGSLKGRRLSSLNALECGELLRQCAAAGDQSQSLLEAWLDRARPGWRSGPGGGSQSTRTGTSGTMSRDEALEVLGLKSGAGADDIRAAHKRLMKQFHPDHGGTNYLATKINLAKDRLLQD
jgi:hypothetical protein